MADRQIAVFFYGLFMDEEILRARGLHPAQVEQARVPGFALRIGKRATLVPSTGGAVHGILMRLTHVEVQQLYSEESVRAYQPEAVIAWLNDGSEVPALCFNLVTPPAPGEANPEYAAKLRDLAQRLKLPADYNATIG